MTLYSATITLILIMDPLGNIPLFLSTLNHVPVKKRRWIILRETFIAFLILTFFLFFGQQILNGMHISQPALAISGGIILFLISIKMIFPNHDDDKTKLTHEPFIVPLAVPLIAGPSTMTMVMLLANQAPNDMLQWFLALTTACFISTVILVCSGTFSKILGERGLFAIERLMGMILTTMAVQMFLTGFEQFLHA